MDKIIIDMTSTATIAITLFGIVFCLMQTKYSRVSRSFAVFLTAITANNIPDAFARIVEKIPSTYTQLAELIIWSPSSLFLAPLFWIYVFTLTSPTQKRPSHLYRHLFLPLLAVLFGLIISVSPQKTIAPLVSNAPLPSSSWQVTFVVMYSLLWLTVYPQMAVYLILIVRRLTRYRTVLRDYYSSTEKYELRWIYVIGILGWSFWLAQTLLLFFAFDPEQAGLSSAFISIASLFGLALVAATTLWGLRQRPPFALKSEIEPQPKAIESQSSEQASEKYEKSALSAEASTRISRKLHSAMERDRLHQDPNLSLWALARHIGASPNYISQTLNEMIGESFFDFVNGYRVAEAMTRLSQTDDTVLAITYDVGFNTRSSFYNAFKRVTGQTPTNYRKTVSLRDGMDDTMGQIQGS